MENLDFFSPLGFDVLTNSDHKAQKIKLFSVSNVMLTINLSSNGNDFKI